MTKKIQINKKTLRVLTADETLLVAGGTCSITNTQFDCYTDNDEWTCVESEDDLSACFACD